MEPTGTALLTVILAVREPDPARLDVCLASITGLHYSPRFDLVIVASGPLPPLCSLRRARLHRLSIIQQPAQGIYSAYNRGLDEVRTPYVMVLGCDDILLPGLDDTIAAIDFDHPPHVVAAAALMQDVGIRGASRFRCGLVFRNWCQQALLYRSDVFATRRFDCRYPIQADHKLNMELVSDARIQIQRRDHVVCHFSSHGHSQTGHDWVFRQDMPGLVRRYYGFCFWLLALLRRRLADLIKHRRHQQPDGGNSIDGPS